MSTLHLPAKHTQDDLALAGALAETLRSHELYVAWSTDGGAAVPVVPARVNQVRRRPRGNGGILARLLRREPEA